MFKLLKCILLQSRIVLNTVVVSSIFSTSVFASEKKTVIDSYSHLRAEAIKRIQSCDSRGINILKRQIRYLSRVPISPAPPGLMPGGTEGGYVMNGIIYLGPKVTNDQSRYYDKFPNTSEAEPAPYYFVSSVGVLVHEMAHAAETGSSSGEEYARTIGHECVDTYALEELCGYKLRMTFDNDFAKVEYVPCEKLFCSVFSKLSSDLLSNKDEHEIDVGLRSMQLTQNPYGKGGFSLFEVINLLKDSTSLYLEDSRKDLARQAYSPLRGLQWNCQNGEQAKCGEAKESEFTVRAAMKTCTGEI